MPLDQWLTADRKQVHDGTSKTYYESGFHVLLTMPDTVEYLRRFKNVEQKVVCVVEIDGEIRSKMHSPLPIFLAEHMRIPAHEWERRIPYNETIKLHESDQ